MAALGRVVKLSSNGTQCMRAARATWGHFHSKLAHVSALRCRDVESNAFYKKYKDKLSSVLEDEPFPRSKECPREKGNPRSPSCYMSAPTLNSVMRVEMIMDKSKEEIATIWEEYHKTKDSVGAVLSSDKYMQMSTKTSHCPLFVYPLPRGEGFEMMFSQMQGHKCFITSLINYQTHSENAPVCLTLTYYTDLQEDKGIVLMLGEVDTQSLTVLEAQFLANQVLLYYCSNDANYFNLVRQFNVNPQDFDYKVLLDPLQNPSISI